VHKSSREETYRVVAERFAEPLRRLARGYEADSDKRRDLLQEIHVALWRSLDRYEERCSMRTWVYRVAHNVAASYVTRQRRLAHTFVGLDELESIADGGAVDEAAIRRDALQRILALVHRLKPLDRQVMLSYLEGIDAASIGEITGISAGNVATKVHRIKAVLARRLQRGEHHGSGHSR
jgi:RNA polymerase sigma-70 factor (ECF subfamily)